MRLQHIPIVLLSYPAFVFSSPQPSPEKQNPGNDHPIPEKPGSFHTLNITPGKVTFVNSCPYGVYIEAIRGPGCSGNIKADVPTGESWSEDVPTCTTAGTSLKVYKNSTITTNPMQFEYGKGDGGIWYDLSFIDRVVSLQSANPDDMSKCTGWEEGIQIGSSGNCFTWWCGPREMCYERGYCDPSGAAAKAASGVQPNSGCSSVNAETELGIAIELCATD